MSKVLKTVAIVAGAVALVATGVGAFAAAGTALAATAASVATFASLTAGVASAGAQLTAPKPVPRGSPTNVIIDTEPPRPYMVGESYSAGILRYQVGYGATLKKVPNPFLWEVKVFSGVGPVNALVQQQFDYAAIGSYYSGFYSSDTQLGARPESTALVPPLSAPATGWGSSHKLSGFAAIGGNYKFDKDGKVFASGRPLHGAIWQGEKVYDPRLDSTYPGGSGSCRLGNESTYVYSANPALHAGTYAFGRYENGIKVFGLGLAEDGIDWAAIVDWANDCETNGWTCHGTIYEGGRGVDVLAQRRQNLDDLCAAGGGRWLVAGAVLSFDWHRPRVSLATVTDQDILEEGGSATAVQSVRDRMNGVRPQYVSPTHNWQQITADEIIGSTYRTEDGQPLTQTWALNLVKDAGQAGELASYALVDSREIGPIELNLNSSWMFYKPGETITVNSELLGYNGQAVIVQRDLDPQTFKVKMVLKGETPAKHDFALGKVATPPPTPVIGQTQEERDAVAVGASDRQVTFNAVSDFSIQTDINNVTTTTLPLTRSLKLFQGGSEITTNATWAVSSASAGITATIGAATGVLSLDVADASGTIIVSATFDDVEYFNAPIAVIRNRPSGVSGGGAGSTGFSDTTWTNINSTGYVPVTDTGAIVQSDASGELQFIANSSYIPVSGLAAVRIKAQYSDDDVTYTDVGAAATGTVASADYGFVSLNQTATGLTASTDYYVRLVAERTSGTGDVEWIDPSFTAQQP